MRSDDFETTVLALLMAILAAVFGVGAVLLDEARRQPRVIRIYEGGKTKEASAENA